MVGNLQAEMGDLKGRAEAAAAELDGGSDLLDMEQRHGAAEGVAELSKLPRLRLWPQLCRRRNRKRKRAADLAYP